LTILLFKIVKAADADAAGAAKGVRKGRPWNWEKNYEE
jgi:hypothetical protein